MAHPELPANLPQPILHGVEHPDEEFEYARCCLLAHYYTNDHFTTELNNVAAGSAIALAQLGSMLDKRPLTLLSDFSLAWGILSFTETHGGASEALSIRDYRQSLQSLTHKWNLRADWSAPSLHVALLARRMAGSGPAPFFHRSVESQGPPKHELTRTIDRILMLDAQNSTLIATDLFDHNGEIVHFDPRSDDWNGSVQQVRELVGRKRLSKAMLTQLLQRRVEIEQSFLQAGYRPRKKPRILEREHAIARYVGWTYLAICPPRRTTREIVALVEGAHDEEHFKPEEVINRGISRMLRLLGFPSRQGLRGT